MRDGTKILTTILRKCPEFEGVDEEPVDETPGYDECSAVVVTPGGLQYVIIVRQLDDEEYVT